MLGKLIKYDCRKSFKVLIVFYSLSLLFGGLTRLFMSFENSLALNIIGQICSGVTISMFFNILINTLLQMWLRFKHNFFGDEAYLTHTLPITKSTHYLSKFLAAFITTFTSTAVMLFTVFIAYFSNDFWNGIKAFISPVQDLFGKNIIVYLIILIFLEFFNLLQCGFTGIILGHKMNNAKTGFSILFGFFVYSASQMLVVFTILAAGLFNNDLMKIFTSSNMISSSTANLVLHLALIIYTLIIIICYFLNTKLFNQGVNLD